MDFNIREILKEFNKEYEFVSDVVYNRHSEVGGMRDADNLFEYLFRNDKEFVKLVQELVRVGGDSFDSSVEKSSLMFALDTLGVLDYFD